MNLKRWLSVILMMGLILALNPLSAQARRSSHGKHHPKYHSHYHGDGCGWDGPRRHGFDRHHKYYRSSWRGSYHRHYVRHVGPPQVVYVTPATPMVEIPYSQPQPFYYQSATPGFFDDWNF